MMNVSRLVAGHARRIAAMVFLLCAALSPLSTRAALTIEITEGVEGALPIAVVPFALDNVTSLPVDVSGVISADLKRSGRFKVLPEQDLVTRPAKPEQVNFRDWRLLNQDSLLIGNIKPNKDGYDVQFYLFNVYKGKQLVAFNVAATPERLRVIAHQIADIVYETLTGEPGAFNTRIAYITVQRDAKKGTRQSLMIADADGYNPREILNSPTEILSPAWSPDGTTLAYARLERDPSRAGKFHFVLYVQDVQSGTNEVVANFPGHNGAPAWSPDGSRLALAMQHRKDSDPSNFDIYILDLKTKVLTRFTDHWAIETYPVWSPDGKYIYFMSDRGGRAQIYRKLVSGGKDERMTFEGNENQRPILSPNGKMLATVQGNGGEYRIAVFELETGQVRVLTDGTLDESPSFAPNGSMIIYAATYRNAQVLSAVSVDGRVKQRLYQEGSVREPAWSPFLRASQ